jgi:hypothetical protein
MDENVDRIAEHDVTTDEIAAELPTWWHGSGECERLRKTPSAVN